MEKRKMGKSKKKKRFICAHARAYSHFTCPREGNRTNKKTSFTKEMEKRKMGKSKKKKRKKEEKAKRGGGHDGDYGEKNDEDRLEVAETGVDVLKMRLP
jgi:hypothetical protein